MKHIVFKDVRVEGPLSSTRDENHLKALLNLGFDNLRVDVGLRKFLGVEQLENRELLTVKERHIRQLFAQVEHM